MPLIFRLDVRLCPASFFWGCSHNARQASHHPGNLNAVAPFFGAWFDLMSRRGCGFPWTRISAHIGSNTTSGQIRSGLAREENSWREVGGCIFTNDAFSAIIGRGNSTMVKMMTKMTMTLTTVNMKMTGTMMITTMRMTGLSPPSLVDHQIHRPKADDLRPKSSASGFEVQSALQTLLCAALSSFWLCSLGFSHLEAHCHSNQSFEPNRCSRVAQKCAQNLRTNLRRPNGLSRGGVPTPSLLPWEDGISHNSRQAQAIKGSVWVSIIALWGPKAFFRLLQNFSKIKMREKSALRLTGADATPPPPVALQGVATPPSRILPQFRVCRRGVAATPPPKGPVAPHPGPPCRVPRVVWTSEALSRSRGGAATLASVALHFDTKLCDPLDSTSLCWTLMGPLRTTKQWTNMGKKRTMTMTKIPSRKPSGTYAHGPLINLGFWKRQRRWYHDQDSLKKAFRHIWSWSSDKSFQNNIASNCCKNPFAVNTPSCSCWK